MLQYPYRSESITSKLGATMESLTIEIKCTELGPVKKLIAIVEKYQDELPKTMVEELEALAVESEV